MSEACSELIAVASDGALEQARLFLLPEDVEERLERDGRYTGERLFSRKPELYQTVVALLKEGQSVRAIKRACGVHHLTIAAVAERERLAIDTGKERAVGEMSALRSALVETLTEDVLEGRLKPEAKAIALGIITDKIELLSGGATVRVETSSGERVPTFQEWREKLVRGREIGLGGEKDGQRGGAPGGLAAAGSAAGVGVHRLELGSAGGSAGSAAAGADGVSGVTLGESRGATAGAAGEGGSEGLAGAGGECSDEHYTVEGRRGEGVADSSGGVVERIGRET